MIVERIKSCTTGVVASGSEPSEPATVNGGEPNGTASPKKKSKKR